MTTSVTPNDVAMRSHAVLAVDPIWLHELRHALTALDQALPTPSEAHEYRHLTPGVAADYIKAARAASPALDGEIIPPRRSKSDVMRSFARAHGIPVTEIGLSKDGPMIEGKVERDPLEIEAIYAALFIR